MVKAKRIRGSEKREALFADQSAATRTDERFLSDVMPLELQLQWLRFQ
jgi:hypothetical protein